MTPKEDKKPKLARNEVLGLSNKDIPAHKYLRFTENVLKTSNK